ncbi:MAG: hypothetical protein HLUCCA05_09525 [Roseibaca calidilacus]|uniref:Uncharacterized protein n=1 Tax=Roseibaca calidilacus TaxID=1666912 RepID=A0A0P7YQQ7_9RHOB|nr:hypothetical protein [Roseibaca calidilacus]KPP92624.1 MAG: hypothetical protein HLUCCA05_09525 [Roseibaca calidilacus]CUX80304.1 hypothetical protein Ga0058931_1012 [Roseibaca calidilacus]
MIGYATGVESYGNGAMGFSVGSLRAVALVAALGLLSACASGAKLGEERAELGDFLLGHAIVVEENAVRGPASRKAEPGAWKDSLEAEMQRRFARYQGDSLYHLGVAVQGYVLAIPGIPLVAAPKSFLILGVTVWDDAAGKKLNEKPHRIIVFEAPSGETAISSGLTQSAEEQMQNLSQNGVAAIERWLATQEDWFPPKAAADAPEATAPAQDAPLPAESDLELPVPVDPDA